MSDNYKSRMSRFSRSHEADADTLGRDICSATHQTFTLLGTPSGQGAPYLVEFHSGSKKKKDSTRLDAAVPDRTTTNATVSVWLWYSPICFPYQLIFVSLEVKKI